MNLPRLPCQVDGCDREGRIIVFGADPDSARKGRAALCMRHADQFYEGEALTVLPITLTPTKGSLPEADAFILDGASNLVTSIHAA